MKIVITGPTGAIGHAIIEECIRRGNEVLAICHKGSERAKNLNDISGCRILYLNLDEYKTASTDILNENLAETGDIFYHLAWQGTTGLDRMDTALQEKNVEFARDAVSLAYALGCKTFIGAGSQAEYGRVEGVLGSDTPIHPENEYGRCKSKAAFETRKMCNNLGMRHIWTRVLSIYGPYDGEKSMIISSIRKMLLGKRVSFTKGEQIWDYLYSEDAGRAFYLLAEYGINNKTYIIGSGIGKKLSDYIEEMRNAVDEMTGPEVKRPLEIGLGDIPYGDKQVMFLKADITELINDTGFAPMVTFDQGIRQTVSYVQKTMK